MTKTKSKPAADETTKAGLGARIGGATKIATAVPGALVAGGKAYVSGMIELGRTLSGFGREILTEGSQHVLATVQAKNLREAGELQLAWAQNRIEMSATHTKEFADLAHVKSKEVIAPIAALFKQDNAA